MVGGSRIVVLVGTLTLAVASAGVARAQSEPTPDQLRGAGEAYDRASAFYLEERWAQAAHFFETAHRLAPSAPALVQAVRSHARAGNDQRAATLALRLQALYGSAAASADVAREVLERSAGRYLRVDVRCGDCSASLDGSLLEHPAAFVEPGVTHRVVAHFETGEVVREVVGEAGESVVVEIEAPAAREGPEVRDPETPADAGGGLSPVVFLIAAAATAVAGGLTLWSGLDALGGVDAYEREATEGDLDVARRLLAEGEDRELRTNVLVGVTAGLAATTVVLLLLTDFAGDDGREADHPPRVALGPISGGALLSLGGRLP